jgi:hypothetical protein
MPISNSEMPSERPVARRGADLAVQGIIANSVVLYDNLSPDYEGSFYGSTNEYGDEIELSGMADYGIITRLFSNTTATHQAVFRSASMPTMVTKEPQADCSTRARRSVPYPCKAADL